MKKLQKHQVIAFAFGIVAGYLLRILYTFIGVYWRPALPTVPKDPESQLGSLAGSMIKVMTENADYIAEKYMQTPINNERHWVDRLFEITKDIMNEVIDWTYKLIEFLFWWCDD